MDGILNGWEFYDGTTCAYDFIRCNKTKRINLNIIAPTYFLNNIGIFHSVYYRILKRVMDIMITFNYTVKSKRPMAIYGLELILPKFT